MGTLQEELVKNGLTEKDKNMDMDKKNPKYDEFLDASVVEHIESTCSNSKRSIYHCAGNLNKNKYSNPNYFKKHSSDTKILYTKRRKFMTKKAKEKNATFLLLKILRREAKDNPLTNEEIYDNLMDNFPVLKVTKKSVDIFLSTFTKTIPDFVQRTKDGMTSCIRYVPQLTDEDADLDFAYSLFIDNNRERKALKTSKVEKMPSDGALTETETIQTVSVRVQNLEDEVIKLKQTINLLTNYIKKEIFLRKLTDEELKILNLSDGM